MSKKKGAARKVAGTAIDPTLPKAPVVVDGKTYNLCFDYGALAEAETFFVAQGHDVNLLRALPTLRLASVREIFPCAVHAFHPELGFEQAQKLVTLQTCYPIANAIVDAWNLSMPKPEEGGAKGDPPEA